MFCSINLVIKHENKEKTGTLKTPTIFDLKIVIANINITALSDYEITVKRNNRLYSVQTDRDIEELGGKTGEELIYVTKRRSCGKLFPPLSTATFTKDELGIGVAISTMSTMSVKELIVLPNERDKCGIECVSALETNGHFRLRLTKEERKCVTTVMEAMETFTNLQMEEKNKYACSSIGSMQPPFGYRSTTLHKEYFVCRKVSKELKEMLKYPSDVFEKVVMDALNTVNNISKMLFKCVMSSLGANDVEMQALLNGLLVEAETLKTLGFTDMMESFRYNCRREDEREDEKGERGDENCDQYRIPCGDHRDVSLLTILPKCIGPSGLEIYNWKEGKWIAAEAESSELDCIVIAGELLHRVTAGKICPTSHRVIVKLNDNNCDRYSTPCELLLNPLYKIDCQKLFPNDTLLNDFKVVETSQDYISRTSQKLVSVNK